MGKAVTGEIEDRPLTDDEKAAIAAGNRPRIGSGSWPSFSDLPPDTLAEYHERSIATKRRNKQARKLAELEAYVEAHREHAARVLGAKLVIIEGLLAEMRVIDQHGREKFDTSLLDEKRLKVLVSALDQFEKTAGMKSKQEKTETVNVNVSHIVAGLKKSLA